MHAATLRLVFAVSAALPLTGTPPAAAAGNGADEKAIVAVVNAEPITRQFLAEQAVLRHGEEVLDEMINRHLIIQACEQKGIQVDGEAVREEIIHIAKKFGLSTDAYLQLLRDERDISAQQYSEEIVWPMLSLRKLVAAEVEVTPEEVNKAFMSQFGEAIKCRMIMTSDRSAADQLHERAVADPEQFGELAKKYSEDEQSASVRGLIPPIRRYTSDPQLEETVFALEEKAISEVMPLGDMWIFLRVERKLPATPPNAQTLPMVRQQITDSIRDEKVRVTATKLFTQLQRQANVVKVLGNPEQEQQYPGVAAIINGQKMTVAKVAERCLERHGKTVLDGEINRKLLVQALRKARLQVTQEDIDAEVSRAAVSFGYVDKAGEPDVEGWLKSVIEEPDDKAIELYVRDAVWPSVALKQLVAGTIEVSDEDLRRGFASNFGPRAEVLAIVLGDQRTAQKVWDMARGNPTEKFFGELASQYSIEPVSQSNIGRVPPVARYGGQDVIEEEAFKLEPGELSGIIVSGDRYVILRLQGYTEPVVNDFDAVKEELVRDLTERKQRLAMATKFDDLKEAAQIDNFLAGTSRTARRSAAAPSGR